jgi:ABC-type amino acid transport substrate-binding protein
MELVGAAFKAQGHDVEWQIVPDARQLEMVRKGEVLAGVNGTKSISDADKDLVQYYTPQMMNIDIVAFYNTKKLPDGPVFEKVSDLKKYSIGLLQGTGSVQVY